MEKTKLFLDKNNIAYRVCSPYHIQIKTELLTFNYYPTKRLLYINGMVEGFHIINLSDLLDYILERKEVDIGKIAKRKTLTKYKHKLYVKNVSRCAICNKALLRSQDATVDHKIPLSKGGANRLDNMQLTCLDCNREKGDKVIFKKERMYVNN